MSGDLYLSLAAQVFVATLKLAGPILAAALVVGVAVSILQAVTQIQEMTLAFVPKLLALGLVMLVAGSWMLRSLVGFTAELFRRLPEFVQ